MKLGFNFVSFDLIFGDGRLNKFAWDCYVQISHAIPRSYDYQVTHSDLQCSRTLIIPQPFPCLSFDNSPQLFVSILPLPPTDAEE